MGKADLLPLLLSLRVSVLATLLSVILGLPAAYFLSRFKGRITDLLDTLSTLPVVLPPTVLGYYILVILGRKSPIGQVLEQRFGVTLVFTPAGAVIAATVAALPFVVKNTKAAFLGISEDLINAARLLGRSEWNIVFSIMIPIGWRSIAAGITLAFARALGDFGATLMVAGNIPGKTTTMPIAIYDALLAGNADLANMLVLSMTCVSVFVLYIVNLLGKRVNKG